MWLAFALLPWLASFAIGWAIIGLLWSGLTRGARTDRWLLRPAAAWIVGVGVASLPHAVWMLAAVDQPGIDVAIDLLLLALATACLAIAGRRPGRTWSSIHQAPTLQPDARGPDWLLWLLLPLLIVGALVGLTDQAWRIIVTPLGDWDAWTIWNLKARYIVRAPADWPGMIASLEWRTHPDYPLMLPITVARLWLAGGESTLGPGLLSLSWWAATIALLVGLTARHAGLAIACVAGLLLIASPAFAAAGWSQCADAPLAAFTLLAAGCMFEALRSRPNPALLALAGLAAGLAAWTKNEGLLILLAFTVSLLLAWLLVPVTQRRGKPSLGPRQRPRAAALLAAAWLIGAATPVALLAVGKLLVAADTDLFHHPRDPGLIAMLLDASRWSAILTEAGAQLWRGPGVGVILGLALLVIVSAWSAPPSPMSRARSKRSPPAPAERSVLHTTLTACAAPCRYVTRYRRLAISLGPVALALAFTLAGYFAVYLITPHPLDWHLFTSAHRLFAQVWPLALWVTFIALHGDPRRPRQHGV